MFRCVLCGYEFEPVEMNCANGCPLQGACHFVCCPRCGYQNLDASQASSVKFVRQLWERVTGARTDSNTNRTSSASDSA